MICCGDIVKKGRAGEPYPSHSTAPAGIHGSFTCLTETTLVPFVERPFPIISLKLSTRHKFVLNYFEIESRIPSPFNWCHLVNIYIIMEHQHFLWEHQLINYFDWARGYTTLLGRSSHHFPCAPFLSRIWEATNPPIPVLRLLGADRDLTTRGKTRGFLMGV